MHCLYWNDGLHLLRFNLLPLLCIAWFVAGISNWAIFGVHQSHAKLQNSTCSTLPPKSHKLLWIKGCFSKNELQPTEADWLLQCSCHTQSSTEDSTVPIQATFLGIAGPWLGGYLNPSSKQPTLLGLQASVAVRAAALQGTKNYRHHLLSSKHAKHAKHMARNSS